MWNSLGIPAQRAARLRKLLTEKKSPHVHTCGKKIDVTGRSKILCRKTFTINLRNREPQPPGEQFHSLLLIRQRIVKKRWIKMETPHWSSQKKTWRMINLATWYEPDQRGRHATRQRPNKAHRSDCTCYFKSLFPVPYTPVLRMQTEEVSLAINWQTNW